MKDRFRTDLAQKSEKQLFQEYFLSSSCWFFETNLGMDNHIEMYDKFKLLIANGLDVHPMNIVLVGSAKVGFSVAPHKAFRDFSEGSDLDIVVVSESIYKKSWRAYYELSKMKKIDNYHSITSDIFRHFVSLKDVDTDVEYFKEWEKKVSNFKKNLQVVFGFDNKINYRIYESWEWVDMYHLDGLSKLIEKECN
ncbi:hypothetical protein [Vibrio sp. ED002]|uniref:hypothetical protein n=1 Tax=Vibrio sp. ED002 TaxID=2785123 RepID=UPI00200DBD97|nr:hypothetical protein [Vibrio sp. ED002]UQA50932.1 hypothetical protein ITG12_00875 [Vibrio sp. ED002]